jgi:hypothetical protein
MTTKQRRALAGGAAVARGVSETKHSHPSKNRQPTQPPHAEAAAVKAEGRNFGWLRSRVMGLSWPRKGVCACGRAQCEVCERIESKEEV